MKMICIYFKVLWTTNERGWNKINVFGYDLIIGKFAFEVKKFEC